MKLVAQLPQDFPATVLVVLHLSAGYRRSLRGVFVELRIGPQQVEKLPPKVTPQQHGQCGGKPLGHWLRHRRNQ
nr:hypothetical protein [Cystobacter ferrugineus]